MNRVLPFLAALLVALPFAGGCGSASDGAFTEKEKQDFGGSKPPPDVMERLTKPSGPPPGAVTPK